MLTITEASEQLRKAGLRVTPQRRAVMQALIGDRSHPLAEVVAVRVKRQMPEVSLSTVYKTLHELADHGLVLKLDLPGGMRFDPNEQRHPHLVCMTCGAVVDAHLSHDHAGELVATARSEGFLADTVSLIFYGSCGECVS